MSTFESEYMKLKDEQTPGFQEAQEVNDLYYKPGIGAEGSAKFYDESAAEYELHSELLEYTGPEKAAQTLADLFPEQNQREKLRILDVAAGTGHVGEQMHKLGFRTLDALEPSQGMLAEARKKGIYGQFFMEYIGDKKLPIDDDTYDAIVICGGMGENHIPRLVPLFMRWSASSNQVLYVQSTTKSLLRTTHAAH